MGRNAWFWLAVGIVLGMVVVPRARAMLRI
jgi:hypothetical protein